MICEQVREAIDMGEKTGSVAPHLSACPPCRQHEAEMSSLLSLLNAQPRVKAPVDFDARLQARLASEDIKVVALVNSLASVKAPANFDFQLRSRLAQAKTSQAETGLRAWVEQFFAQSFSLGQAASAVAAVALIVAFSVTQINRSGNPAEAPVTNHGGLIALNSAPNPATKNNSLRELPAPQTVVASPASDVRPRAGRHLTPVVNRNSAAPSMAEPKLIASFTNEQVIFNAKTRQEMRFTASEKIAYGQQMAKFVPAPKVEPMNEVF